MWLRRVRLKSLTENNFQMCVLCRQMVDAYVHVAQGSRRNSKVYLCKFCGLCQTFQEKDLEKGKRTLSSNADWGNVRHAKGLRLDAQKSNLKSTMTNLPKYSSVLDIGSSRGQFIDWGKKEFPNFNFVGVEPDVTIAKRFGEQNTQVILSKIEEVKFKDRELFDFIFCNHTLEHVDSFPELIEIMGELLKPEGKIWIDVPNLLAIRDPYVIEEFFIDKHNFHFEIATLTNALLKNSMEVQSDFSDNFNIVFVISKNQMNKKIELEPSITAADFKNYQKNLLDNRALLPYIAKKIESMPKVAIYGAGRILDALIRFGKLDLQRIVVVDRYLAENGMGLGISISDPSIIEWREFEDVIVLARSSTSEICNWLESRGAKKITTFESLISDSKKRELI